MEEEEDEEEKDEEEESKEWDYNVWVLPLYYLFLCLSYSFFPQSSSFSSTSASYDIYQCICSEFLAIFDSTNESDVEQVPRASSCYLFLLSLLFIIYLMFI